MSAAASYPRRHAVSAHEFLQMGSAGVFAPEARLELIAGEIIEMVPLVSPAHASVLSEVTSRLIRGATDRVIVSPQCPLVLGEGSVPQPDLALLKPCPDNYFRRHPHASDALLVVEVSDTTLRFDLDAKVPLYALAGVPEAWVIVVERRTIRAFRHPDESGYRTSFTAAGSDSVQPMALEGVAIAAAMLFPG